MTGMHRSCVAALALCTLLSACDETQVESNPEPESTTPSTPSRADGCEEVPGGALAVIELHRATALQTWSDGDEAIAWSGETIHRLVDECWTALPAPPSEIRAARVEAGSAQLVTSVGVQQLDGEVWSQVAELPTTDLQLASRNRAGELLWFSGGDRLWRWGSDHTWQQQELPRGVTAIDIAHQRTGGALWIAAANHMFRLDEEWAKTELNIPAAADLASSPGGGAVVLGYAEDDPGRAELYHLDGQSYRLVHAEPGLRWSGLLPRGRTLYAVGHPANGDTATVAIEVDPPFHRSLHWSGERVDEPHVLQSVTVGTGVVALLSGEAIRFSDIMTARSADGTSDQLPDQIGQRAHDPPGPEQQTGECGFGGGVRELAERYAANEIDGAWADGERALAWTSDDVLELRAGCFRWLPRPPFCASAALRRGDDVWAFGEMQSAKLGGDAWITLPRPNSFAIGGYHHDGAGGVWMKGGNDDAASRWTHRDSGWWEISSAPEHAPPADAVLVTAHRRGPDELLLIASRQVYRWTGHWEQPQDIDTGSQQNHLVTVGEDTYSPSQANIRRFDGRQWSTDYRGRELYVEAVFEVGAELWAAARIAPDPSTFRGHAFLKRESDGRWERVAEIEPAVGEGFGFMTSGLPPIVIGNEALILTAADTPTAPLRSAYVLEAGQWTHIPAGSSD